MEDERAETNVQHGAWRSPGGDGETEATHGESLPVWVVIGALSGAALLGLLCLVILPEKQTLATVSARALAYTAASGAAGAVVVAALWSFFRARPGAASSGIVQAAAEACLFLPCIVLLQLKQSVWMLGFTALATALFWRGVRPSVDAAERTGEEVETTQRAELDALYGLPVETLPLGRMIFLAACVQAAGIAAVAGYVAWASSLLSVWMLVMMWQWSETRAKRRRSAVWGWREFAGLAGTAVLLTIFFLLPSRWGSGGGFAEGKDSARTRGPDGEGRRRDNSDGYAGIILLPPPVKKTKIVAPKPRTALFAAGHSEPLVIPFDGAYWYFKAPAKGPSKRAHIAQGRATEVNVRSSDRYPLLMEAHQALGGSINLDCCREIEVALTNADTRPGKIGIGVVLTDTTSPARSHELLGMKTIASSDLTEIPAGREPVEETIRFPIPRGLKQCDEITVVFVPSRERERTGAKVSVRNFVLVPR